MLIHDCNVGSVVEAGLCDYATQRMTEAACACIRVDRIVFVGCRLQVSAVHSLTYSSIKI